MKYIDTDQIRAEIGRQKEINKRLLDGQLREGCLYAFNQVLFFLDTLPEQPASDFCKENCKGYQETGRCFLDGPCYLAKQPVEGLEEEIDKYIQPIQAWEVQEAPFTSLEKCARHFAEWGMNQCPLPEDTTIFQKGVAEGRRLEREEQKPELIQHPAISYMYNADAGRGEQLKQAILALLKSDLIQVAGRRFTKTELIDWVETRPAEMEEEQK